MTKIKTPTRVVTITLPTRTGEDQSRDYLRNCGGCTLEKDPEGDCDFLMSDEDADWWEALCAEQRKADAALYRLDRETAQAIVDEVGELPLDTEDVPGAILRAVAEREEGVA